MSSKNHKIYFIQLKALKPFFFGGENTFGADNVNYLVKSNYMPQQTTLLGMLRYQLLEQNGLLKNGTIQSKSLAADLIGEASFSNDNVQTFGVIDHLSPLFLVKNGKEHFFPMPFSHNYWLEKNDNATTFYQNGKAFGQSVLLKHKVEDKETGKLEEKTFSYKNDLPIGFVNTQDKTDTAKWLDEIEGQPTGILVSKSRVGIKKRQMGDPDQSKGFYKQTSFEFNNTKNIKWSFGLYVQINETEQFKNPTLQNAVVMLGGERSAFQMEVEEVAKPTFKLPSDTFTKSDNFDKVVLLSDAYVDKSIYDKCLFAVTKTVDFRHIETLVEGTTDYNNLKQVDNPNNTTLRKSKKYNLLRRGSVFYCEKSQTKDVTAALESQAAFRKIGYNFFSVVKASKS